MTNNSITINGTTYERVEAKYPELQCEECDWNELCEEDNTYIELCHALSELDSADNIFKKQIENFAK